jgi:hypothetical protein
MDQEAINERFCVVQKGSIVILEMTKPLPLQAMDAIRGALKVTSDAVGVQFVLLPYGLQVAQVKVVESEGAKLNG